MKQKKSKLIQALEEYFANTSEEQLKKDLEELEKYNQYGPELEDCLELGRLHCLEVMKNMENDLKNEKDNSISCNNLADDRL